MCTAGQYQRLVLALSDERDQWRRLAWQLWHDGFEAAQHNAVTESLSRAWPGPRYVSEIERARYGPLGREHFGDPRPGDYPGRGVRTVSDPPRGDYPGRGVRNVAE